MAARETEQPGPTSRPWAHSQASVPFSFPSLVAQRLVPYCMQINATQLTAFGKGVLWFKGPSWLGSLSQL